MLSSIENLKQNLSKIVLDVHDGDDDDEEELKIYGSTNGDRSSVYDRRNSHHFAHSKSNSRSTFVTDGIDSSYNSEIDHYKTEIRRLQESEAEIKALAVNYSALLKEKEDQICRLNQENGSLKQNLTATKEALNLSRIDNTRASAPAANILKGSGDQSPKRQQKSPSALAKNRFAGGQTQNGIMNGVAHISHLEATKEKELADLLEEKNRSMAAMQANHEQQLKQLRMELQKEQDKFEDTQLKLEEKHKVNESLREELRKLKMEENKTSIDINNLRGDLSAKTSEIRNLELELQRGKDKDSDDTLKSLKKVIATLEKENADLKMAKNELEIALEVSRKSLTDKTSQDGKINSSENSHMKAELEISLKKLEKDLKETCRQRDKARHELARLKQHLLEKESEESEKMDEDSKIIEELRQNNEYLKAQLLNLDKALKQAIASQEEVKMSNNSEILKSKEIIEDLNRKLANCMSIIESKDTELINLQTALGQYFAEIEAKEHLERQLSLAREESAKLSELLKDADKITEASNREKEDILAKLTQTERTLADSRNRVDKLEEDNSKLRRALEQSMTRLNRMSVDSDYLVDRRIVIKLLVTYFQRNHSKEVLDLMVRMLGFSDEDKQRIGIAQQGGRGVVRGVLGLPGRLVGGILGGSSTDANSNLASDQSFADLWVDFLLKETEEREKREAMEDTSRSRTNEGSESGARASPSPSPSVAGGSTVSSFQRSGFSTSHSQNYYSPITSQAKFKAVEHSDPEFSTVPLTSSFDDTTQISRLTPKQ
ncbi:hypothetical protein K2173_013412 [Erythroxylum novogranatense]|uniref:Golgin candidate 4 n=1 Tax=Erythroxylum novogranatense TaxID=1862640 RepID=A0AAV8SAA7_9ROSI|nr:hypothetical protein K2173_013412 [Erythroxylum novogranatense]